MHIFTGRWANRAVEPMRHRRQIIHCVSERFIADSLCVETQAVIGEQPQCANWTIAHRQIRYDCKRWVALMQSRERRVNKILLCPPELDRRSARRQIIFDRRCGHMVSLMLRVERKGFEHRNL